MILKKKDKRQRIPLRKYTKGGRVSTITGIVSIVLFCVAVAISIAKKGNAGTIVGVLGMLTFITAVIGFIIGIISFKEENKFFRFTWIGTILNLIIWVAMMLMLLCFI